jgi:hypothetical protein
MLDLSPIGLGAGESTKSRIKRPSFNIQHPEKHQRPAPRAGVFGVDALCLEFL